MPEDPPKITTIFKALPAISYLLILLSMEFDYGFFLTIAQRTKEISIEKRYWSHLTANSIFNSPKNTSCWWEYPFIIAGFFQPIIFLK